MRAAWLGSILALGAMAAIAGGCADAPVPPARSAAVPASPRSAAPAPAPARIEEAERPSSVAVHVAPAPVAQLTSNIGGEVAPRAVADVPHSAAMLIYTAHLTMAVYQVEAGLDAVERIGREEGGYLSSRQDNAVTIRVPRDRFDDAVARVEALGDVTHRDIQAQDVTDEYVDLDARLRNAYAMRTRLGELLAHATVKEALDIERELGRVTEEIERMEGRLKLLRAEIAFSTIGVTFAPVVAQAVHDSSLLAPFPWLRELGLESLLDVRRAPR